MDAEPISCPFCGYKAVSEYQIMLHMETLHPEGGGDSPFVVRDDASIAAMISYEEDEEYASCPIDGCGEAILLTELDSHIEMHTAEEDDSDHGSIKEKKALSFGKKLSNALQHLDDGEKGVGSEQEASKAAWRNILNMPNPSKESKPSNEKGKLKRLGKKELGPHANEKQMPQWLIVLLQSDGEFVNVIRKDADGKKRKVRVCPNQADGILPVIKRLLEQDRETRYAYLCHPAVRHVSALRKEGGFCGYRNIQMLTSYIVGVKSQGFDSLQNKIPTIFDIQEYIEHAWDIGINSQGRVETGGIRGTRKYIGTPDAQAMCLSLGIACDTRAFKSDRSNRHSLPAYERLLEVVEKYFAAGNPDSSSKIRLTSLPPLYFQHQGHSMTIIGIEKKRDRTVNLLVFDPMFHDSAPVTKLVGQDFEHKDPPALLKAYRRGARYLRRYHEFETLQLMPPANQVGDLMEGGWGKYAH